MSSPTTNTSSTDEAVYRSNAKKTVMTVSGIRPDFIRMSAIFKKFDEEFNHILVHTGQHYDTLLSDVFFKELNIRTPDYVLNAGKCGGTHYHQLGYLSVAIVDLIKNNNLKPDIIMFLGDANTVCAALPLRKEGYVVGHIEAGMRSFDKRMLEEINRTTCDHCSNILFVYHEAYKQFLANENIRENVHVVGNTILEVARPFIPTEIKRNEMILVDIHRSENFKYPERLRNIIAYANLCASKFGLPVKMLRFKATCAALETNNIDMGSVELVDLMGYKRYLDTVYHSKFIISDSGTGQEEPALFGTPVIVPRDFTERPQSLEYKCSQMINVNENKWQQSAENSFIYLENVFEGKFIMDTQWLGNGNTAELVVKKLSEFLQNKAK